MFGGYPPTAIGYPPTAIGYPPTAIGYPPAAIIGCIGHSEFFFSSFHCSTPWASHTHTIIAGYREIRVLRLADHPNIVKYYKSTRTKNAVHMFMEYCPGGSIKAKYSSQGPIDMVNAKRYLQDILSGLAFLHEKDIIHRDIKGDNVLLGLKDDAKLADFGVWSLPLLGDTRVVGGEVRSGCGTEGRLSVAATIEGGSVGGRPRLGGEFCLNRGGGVRGQKRSVPTIDHQIWASLIDFIFLYGKVF